jgi:hypothetical protein
MFIEKLFFCQGTRQMAFALYPAVVIVAREFAFHCQFWDVSPAKQNHLLFIRSAGSWHWNRQVLYGA